MRRLIPRSFVNAQALVGVVLTVSWLVVDLDLQTAAVPLYTVAALLLLYSLVPEQWTRSPDRLEGPFALDTTARQMSKQLRSSEGMQRLGDFAAQHRFSIQLALTSIFLFAAALLLQIVAPAPGV
jgi:hypothetical protein